MDDRTQAFTIVELLVVITIIVVLLALLAPALDKAMEAAQRVQCASQLKVVHTASYLYTQDNRNTFFISRYRAVPHAFNASPSDQGDNARGAHNRAQPGDDGVNWIEALATVGLAVGQNKTVSAGIGQTVSYRDAAPVWNCPSSLNPKTYFSPTYRSLATQYVYFGGHDKWYNTAQGLRPGQSPVKLTRSSGMWVLAADWTSKSDNVWNANHMIPDGPWPDGGNQVHVDGSAAWMPLEGMGFLTGWNHTPALFIWQSDLGKDGLASNMRAEAFK